MQSLFEQSLCEQRGGTSLFPGISYFFRDEWDAKVDRNKAADGNNEQHGKKRTTGTNRLWNIKYFIKSCAIFFLPYRKNSRYA